MNDPTGTISQIGHNLDADPSGTGWLASARDWLCTILPPRVSGRNGGPAIEGTEAGRDPIYTRAIRVCNRDRKLIPVYVRIHEILKAGPQ